jgi:hypothetical protein
MKKLARASRIFVLVGLMFFMFGIGIARGDFIFGLTGSAGPDGGTGVIDLIASSGGLAQLGSFNFANTSFLASSVPGGITYQYGTADVSALAYSITGSALTMDLSTNILSGTFPPGVDPGIGNHIVFGPQGGALPQNGFASGSACNNPGPQGCSAFFQGTFTSTPVVTTPPPPSPPAGAAQCAGGPCPSAGGPPNPITILPDGTIVIAPEGTAPIPRSLLTPQQIQDITIENHNQATLMRVGALGLSLVGQTLLTFGVPVASEAASARIAASEALSLFQRAILNDKILGTASVAIGASLGFGLNALEAPALAQADMLDSFFLNHKLDPPVVVPTVQAGGPISQQLAGLFQDTIARGVALNFVTMNFLGKLAAYEDALAAGNAGLAASLLPDLALAGGAVRDVAQQQALAYQALRAGLKAAGIPDIPLGPDVLSAYLADINKNGFLPDEVALLQQLGLSQADIDRIKADLLALDPNSAPTSLFSFLDLAAQADSNLSADLTPTPEPTTLLLWGTTMAGLGLVARWRRVRNT